MNRIEPIYFKKGNFWETINNILKRDDIKTIGIILDIYITSELYTTVKELGAGKDEKIDTKFVWKSPNRRLSIRCEFNDKIGNYHRVTDLKTNKGSYRYPKRQTENPKRVDLFLQYETSREG